MNCLIDNAIHYYVKKGKRVEVLRRYIKMKYRINMDLSVLKARLKTIYPQVEIG